MSYEKRINEIKARLKNSTPGPWKYRHGTEIDHWELWNPETAVWVVQDDAGVEPSTDDLEFIAHAPTDIARLIKALEKCREQRNYELGDASEDYTGGIKREIAEYDAELDAILNGEGET